MKRHVRLLFLGLLSLSMICAPALAGGKLDKVKTELEAASEALTKATYEASRATSTP